MNKEQLVNLIVIPTLKEIPSGLSKQSVRAVSMIIAHESAGGKYIRQVGGGPALGITQIEPATHDDTWKHGDSIWDNALHMGIIDISEYRQKRHPKAERLLYDLRYAVFMTRQRLFMKIGALPSNIDELSIYLKKHWNSSGGAASNMSYRDDYLKWGY